MNKFNFMDAIAASDFTKKPPVKNKNITLITYILENNFFNKSNILTVENKEEQLQNIKLELQTLEIVRDQFLSEIEELKASEYAFKKISINGRDMFDIELERIAKKIDINLSLNITN